MTISYQPIGRGPELESLRGFPAEILSGPRKGNRLFLLRVGGRTLAAYGTEVRVLL